MIQAPSQNHIVIITFPTKYLKPELHTVKEEICPVNCASLSFKSLSFLGKICYSYQIALYSANEFYQTSFTM